jgi:hypothetical protein
MEVQPVDLSIGAWRVPKGFIGILNCTADLLAVWLVARGKEKDETSDAFVGSSTSI